MRAVVYARQSQDRDGNRLGVDRQLADCEKLCADRGWTVVERVIENDTSATSRRPRPGFQRVQEMVERRSVDIVVAWHVDRLVRHLRDLEDVIERCERAGVRVATASGDVDLTTDAGRLVGRILASVARGEVERKSARQQRAQQQAAEAGRRVGGRRPFGYEPDGLTIRPGEADALRDGYDAILSGVPLAAVARDWNARGVPTGQGSPWTHDSIRHCLLNPRNAGLRRYRGEVVAAAAWPPVVPEETWRATVALLTDPDRRTPPTGGRALLTGLALCGVCGSVVHGGRTRYGARTYRCRAAYGHVSRAAEPVDEYVAAVVVERLSRPDAADLLVDRHRPDVGALRTEAMSLRGRLESLAVDFADGCLTSGQLRTATERVRGRLGEVELALADAGRVSVVGPLVQAADVQAVWVGLDLDRQRAVLDALVTVTLQPPGRGTRTFRPETVQIRWKENG